MRIIDRYILKSLLPAFFVCIFVFVFLYVVIDIFSHLDEILKLRVNLSILKDYYLYFLPLIFVQTCPIASLLSTVWTLGQLNRNNEIIALRAAGLSVWHIIKSLIFFGLIISILIFIINDKVIPLTQAKISEIKEEKFQAKGTQPKIKEFKNLSIYGLDNRLFHFSRFIYGQNKIEGITILEQDQNQNLLSKIVAAEGYWQKNGWLFKKCLIYRFDELNQLKGVPEYYPEKLMNLPETPNDLLRQSHDITFMNLAQLSDYILRLSKGGATAALRNFEVDFQNKISFPFTSLIIIFIGIPFSLYIRSRVTMFGSLGICIAITFLYFVTNAVSLALGKAGLIAPALSAWLTHIIFGLAALVLINNLP